MNALQRLPQADEDVILALVRANDLPVSQLRCDFTRQRDAGVGRTSWGLEYDISYSLMLCRHCGNLEGTRNNALYCPWKLRALRTRLLET